MSAYIVNEEHIRFLVSSVRHLAKSVFGFCYTWNFESHRIDSSLEKATKLGQKFWDANVLSVNRRYSENTKNLVYLHKSDFDHQKISLVQIFKAIDGYAYQCSEFHNWRNSEIYTVLAVMKCKLISCLPGYDEAAWAVM